jgi:hypothetical protein
MTFCKWYKSKCIFYLSNQTYFAKTNKKNPHILHLKLTTSDLFAYIKLNQYMFLYPIFFLFYHSFFSIYFSVLIMFSIMLYIVFLSWQVSLSLKHIIFFIAILTVFIAAWSYSLFPWLPLWCCDTSVQCLFCIFLWFVFHFIPNVC